MPREDLRLKPCEDYGFGLAVVVVVVVSVFVSLLLMTGAVVLISFVFSVLLEGFTMVVLFSVFFSAGAAGATVSVFCSHAPKSAALARMQISFFIVVNWLSILGLNPESEQGEFPALLKLIFRRPSLFRRSA